LRKDLDSSFQHKSQFACFFIAPTKAGSEELEQDVIKVTSPVLGRGERSNPISLLGSLKRIEYANNNLIILQ